MTEKEVLIQLQNELEIALTNLSRSLPLEIAEAPSDLSKKIYSNELSLRQDAFTRRAIVLNSGHHNLFQQRLPNYYHPENTRQVKIEDQNEILTYYEIDLSSLATWFETEPDDQRITFLVDILSQENCSKDIQLFINTLNKLIGDDEVSDYSLYLLSVIVSNIIAQDMTFKIITYLEDLIKNRASGIKDAKTRTLYKSYQDRIFASMTGHKNVTTDRKIFDPILNWKPQT